MEKIQKILITGGLGYIGSHTAIVFGQAGYDIVIIDNLSNSHIEVLDKITELIGKAPLFYDADLRNFSAIEKILEENKDIQGVIHLAAKKSVGESCQDPFLYYENNIKGTTNLLENMLNYNIKNIVLSSSATVYDAIKLIPPYSENDRLNTNNPYGTTNIVMEYLLKDMSFYKGFNSVILRYFNPIGAHESGLIGETPKGIPSNLVPFAYKVAKGEIEHLQIFGDNYNTEDGTGVRDYVHVMDVAEAHLSAYKHIVEFIDFKNLSEKEDEIGLYDIFNIGTGYGKSVKEIIDITEKVTEKEIKYEIVERRLGDVDISIANPLKAKQIFGREAKRSIFQAIEDGRKFVNDEVKEEIPNIENNTD